ncbi:MAG: site-specific DNA-methyltransferase, partial [Chloroflexi bacterium]|nr:site-specific DNA-methyltransferase [Chloroflexota bacterium]
MLDSPHLAPGIAEAVVPYYHDGVVTIYHADSTKPSFLADSSIDLVVTSPPY